MAIKKPTIEELLARASKEAKDAFLLIDEEIGKGTPTDTIMKRILDDFEGKDEVIEACRAYLEAKCPENEVPSADEENEEDALERELESMLDDPVSNVRYVDALEFVGGYRLYCCVNMDPDELPVEGVISQIIPVEGEFLHVDLELPDIHETGDLHIVVSIDEQRRADSWFYKENIPLFRDGRRLHVTPINILDFLNGVDEDKDIENKADHIDIILFKNDHEIGRYQIDIDNSSLSVDEEPDETADDVFAEINRYKGWDNFKARMMQMCDYCEVDGFREFVGLRRNPPRLHTAIIGNPGTGRSTAVRLMARLYKALGLLDSCNVSTVLVQTLASSSPNGESDKIASIMEQVKRGVLVIDRAHELYKTERNGYNSEGHIITALVNLLGSRRYDRMMVVLVGEPEGMESLLSSYPELRNLLAAPIYMEDLGPRELFGMFDSCCDEREVKLSKEARGKLQTYVQYKYNHRGAGFLNGRMVEKLFDGEIIPAMYSRLQLNGCTEKEQLELILPQDIPVIGEKLGDAMAELDELVGLGTIKSKLKDYLNAVRLASRRMALGLPTNMPRLNMAFLGNPGTGKTTVAEIIGRVFASWGILSGGRVIRTEKSQLVGQYIGETEFKMRNLLERARGNILFIDEAYQLVEGGEKDYGRIVMNSLLTELGKENLDMVVILAGYTAPMKKLLECNEGVESRFPNVFNFEDYTIDELMEIGKLMIRKQGFTLSEGAERNLRSIIEDEYDKPSPRFGNGRFVSNILQNEILATLGERTAKLENPTAEDLSVILPEDVVVGKALKDVVFDDLAIDDALSRLDALSGLDGVKKAIHNFVRSARYLHSIGEPYVGKGLLSWRFIGNSGNGKSTVAEIMACILRGMRLIANSHITEIKGERIFNVSEPDCDSVLREAVKKSCNGLIFIDVDDPKFTDDRMSYGRSLEQIRLKMNELTVEAGGECALILAELSAPNQDVLAQLYESGVYEFDHTLIFKDFTPDELFQILGRCLGKFNVGFSLEAESHMRAYLDEMSTGIRANARTMKLMSRTIYQQVILREADMPERPALHQVLLEDVKTFKWKAKKGRIGY